MVGICNLKCEARIWNVVEDFASRIGITNRVVDCGVGWRGNNAEDDALIFRRRQFVGRHVPKESAQERQSNPDGVNSGARSQGTIKMSPVPIAETIKGAIHQATESFIDTAGAQQMRRHHGGKC